MTENTPRRATFRADAPVQERLAHDEPKPKHKGLRIALIVLGSLLVLLVAGIGIAYAILAANYNEVERVSIEQDPTLTRPEPIEVAPEEKAPINILLLGSDSRDTSSTDIAIEELRGFRSDVMMVAQISADREHLTFMSIMRDNWVPIQGHGEAKINAAIAFGGLPLAVNTVENLIDARIDHVALIDFESFKGLTDAVGGVTVHNEIAFTALHGGFSFDQGEITLNGAEALGFVRERYAFNDGDYQRVRNQQAYLKGLTKALLSRETLTSPEKVMTAFGAAKPYVILDHDLDLNRAVSLGYEMRGLRSEDLGFFTSPTLGTGSAGGQSIVVVDWEGMAEVQAAFRAGTLHEHAAGLPARSEVPEHLR